MSPFNLNENELPHARFTPGEQHDDSARRRADDMISQNFSTGAYQPASTDQMAPSYQTAPTFTPPAYDALASPFDHRPGTFGIPAQPGAFNPNGYGVAQDQVVNNNPFQVYDPPNDYQQTFHHTQPANLDTSGGFPGLNNSPFNSQGGDVYTQGGDAYYQSGDTYTQGPANLVGQGFTPNNGAYLHAPVHDVSQSFTQENSAFSQFPASALDEAFTQSIEFPSQSQPVYRDFDVAAVPDVENFGIIDADVQESLVQDYTTNSPSFRSNGAFAGPDGTLSRDVNASFDTSVFEVKRTDDMYKDLMHAVTDSEDELLGNYELLDSHLAHDGTQILDVDAEEANDIDDLPPPDKAIDSVGAAANDDDARTDKTESFDWGSESENDGYNIEYDLDFADLPPPSGPGDDDGEYAMPDADELQDLASPSRPWTQREDAAVMHAMQWAEMALEHVEPDQRWQRISQHLATNYNVLRFAWTVAERWDKVVSAEFADGGYFHPEPQSLKDMHDEYVQETRARTAEKNKSGRQRQRAAAKQPHQLQQQSVPGEKRKRGSTSFDDDDDDAAAATARRSTPQSFPALKKARRGPGPAIAPAASPQLSSSLPSASASDNATSSKNRAAPHSFTAPSTGIDAARGNHPTKRRRRTTATGPTTSGPTTGPAHTNPTRPPVTISTRLLATGHKVLDQFPQRSGRALPASATQILAATIAEFAPYAFAAPGESGGADDTTAATADASGAADQGIVETRGVVEAQGEEEREGEEGARRLGERLGALRRGVGVSFVCGV
ncbi:hypothetical protein SLS58_006416 [Diplodia intermedia]|uniref:Myb-like domain-containing protein n=1 Tax=Diplodia intermedia TaxID=856260 RepID=A0ABR3TN14_9PEZI